MLPHLGTSPRLPVGQGSRLYPQSGTDLKSVPERGRAGVRGCHPLPRRGGEFLARICLRNRGVITKRLGR